MTWLKELPDTPPAAWTAIAKKIDAYANVAVIDCPFCGEEHRHGIHEDGSVGWRMSHCRDNKLDTGHPPVFVLTNKPAESTTLYRLRDIAGRLLYVGIAGNPGRRFDQHAKDKAWWGEVASVNLQHFDSRPEALKAEREAIELELPVYNVVHNRKKAKKGAKAPASTIGVLPCDHCGEPIAEGYIQACRRQASEVREAWEAWEQRNPPSWTPLPIHELFDLPDHVQWDVTCKSCDQIPDSDTLYALHVERGSTVHDFHRQVAHIMTKGWAEGTDIGALLTKWKTVAL